MGVISVSTPYVYGQSLNGAFHECPVIRLQRQKVSTVVRNKGVPILAYCHPDKPALCSQLFKSLSHLHIPYTSPLSVNLDLILHIGWAYHDEQNPRPGWSDLS